MPSFFRFVCKMILSGVLAVIVLSCFCLFYDNAPVTMEQPSGVTNFRFAPDVKWSYMTEGFGYGKTDSLGYNNTYVSENVSGPIIAFLGSSHTEAFHVPQDKNYVSRIQKKIIDDNFENDYRCINLGASSHYFNVTVSNFSYFADSFKDVKYVVVEANNLAYSPEQIQEMLSAGYHDPLVKDGFYSKLLDKIPALRVPFLRTLKKQYDRVQREGVEKSEDAAVPVDYAAYKDGIKQVMMQLAAIADENDFKMIVVYHYPLHLDDENGLVKTDDPELVEEFKQACEDASISFINVSDMFIDHYRLSYELPYGFMNTTMGEGHLNLVGHEIISDAVYQRICELEKGEMNGI